MPYLGVAQELGFHHAQGRVGGLEGCAFRAIDGDQELRLVGGGEERETQSWHQQQAGCQRPEREQQCSTRTSQRALDHGGIHTRDDALQQSQRAVSGRVFHFRQEHARQERDDSERHEERGQHSEHYGKRQAAGELAGALGQAEQWQKSQQQRRSASQHGQRDLSCGVDRGSHTRGSVAHMPGDVLDHDDGVVDQQAKRDHEAGDAHLVEGESQRPETGETHGERQRNRYGHDACRPQSERQQRDAHQCECDQEIPPQMIEAVAHVGRLDETRHQLDRGGQLFAERRDARIDPALYREDVRAILHVGRDPGCGPAVVAAEVALLLDGPSGLGDVSYAHRAAVAHGEDGVADFVDGFVIAGGFQIVATGTDIDRTTGNVGALATQCADHGCHVHAALRETRRIESDPHFRAGNGPGLGAPDPRDGFEQVFQILGEALEIERRGAVINQRELHDVHQRRVRFTQFDTADAFGQAAAQAVDLPHHFVVLGLGIGVPVELELYHAGAVAAGRADFLDVVEFRQRVFDRVDHQALDIEWVGTRQVHDHRADGDGEIGIFAARYVQDGYCAQRDQQHEKHQRELPARYRESPDPHELSPRGLTRARPGRHRDRLRQRPLRDRQASVRPVRRCRRRATHRCGRCAAGRGYL